MADPLVAIWNDIEAENAQSQVIRGLDGDKQKAAKAMEMTDGDQDAAQYAYGNYDLAHKAYRSSLANGIVNNDPILQAYFNTNPMASIVSKDDIPNLANYSDSMRKFKNVLHDSFLSGGVPMALETLEDDPHGMLAATGSALVHSMPSAAAGVAGYAGAGALATAGLAAAGVAAPAIVVGGVGIVGAMATAYLASVAEDKFVETFFPEEAERRKEAREAHPWMTVLGEQLAMTPFLGVGGIARATLKSRLMGSAIVEATELAQEAIFNGELDPAHLIGAALGGFILAGRPTFFGNEAERLGRSVATGIFLGRYFRKGEAPPIGVNKAYDFFVSEDTKNGMKMHDEAMKLAKAAETGELSPDLMDKFHDLLTKGGIKLKWDAVNKLYGDLSPAPGDKLLGDMPGVAEQFERSRRFSGEDIYIPWKDWTKVDPDTEKVLHDDIRLPDKFTLNEAKDVKPPADQDWVEFPMQVSEDQQLINDTRQSTGLEPLLQDPVQGPEPDTLLFKPGTILPKRDYERLVKKIDAIADKDEARRLEAEQKKAATRRKPEWDARLKEVREDVRGDIDQKPDFVAWKFLTTGEIGGQKLGRIPKVNPASLSQEQLDNFPSHWLSPGGLDADMIANMTGFKTGDDFAANMKAFRDIKGRESFGRFRTKAIEDEANRRMEREYGKFEDLTADEARQYVVSPEAEDMLWTEYPILAQMAGQQIPFNREAVKRMAKADFGEKSAKDARLINITRELALASRETHDAWDKGDLLRAFQTRQKVVHLAAVANEAKRWESIENGGLRVLKQFYKTEPTNTDPEFAMWMHQLMLLHEIPVDRSQESIDRMLQQPQIVHKNFKDFVESHNYPVDDNDPISVGLPLGYRDYGTTYNPNMPIPEDLLNPKGLGKIFDDMRVRERWAIYNAAKVMKKLGQDKLKGTVNIRGEDINAEGLANKLVTEIERFPLAMQSVDPSKWTPLNTFRWTMTKLMTFENFAMRLASQNERSPWFTHVLAPTISQDGINSAHRKELAAKIKEVLGAKPIEWWKRRVDNNVILHPITKVPLDFDNENIVELMSNTASEAELNHTAAGYGLEPDVLKAYRNSVVTKEHFNIAKDISKIYDWAQGLEDNMTMQRSGTLLERLEPGEVEMSWGVENGFYHPRKRDVALDPPGLKIESHPRNNVNVALAHGWAIRRTNQPYAVQLHLTGLASDVERRLKYVAMQPVADIYNKVLRRPEVQQAIYKHFGPEYVDMMKEYYNDISGVKGMPTDLESGVNYWFNKISGNLVSDVIGFNLQTLEKHAPQSILQSVFEVGPDVFKNVARRMYSGNQYQLAEQAKFMYEGRTIGDKEFGPSRELPRRRQRLKHDPEEVGLRVLGERGNVEKFMKWTAEAGAAPIGFIDQRMSELTWLARYESRMAENLQGIAKEQLTPQEFINAQQKAHQLAVDMADRMVRITHGSTAITGKPEWLRSQNAMVRASAQVMNFFNNALNRRFRTLYMIQDLVKGRSPRPVMQDVGRISMDLFTYALLPVLIEDMVEPIGKEDDDAATYYSKFAAQGLAAPIPFVRELVHWGITGTEPTFGMTYNLLRYARNAYKSGEKYLFEDDESKLGDLAENVMGLIGARYGGAMAIPGRWANYAIKLQQGEDNLPEDWSELHRIIKKGRTQETPREATHQRLIERIME